MDCARPTHELTTGRTWAEIDLARIARNARAVRGFAGAANGGAAVMAVVKADAYGHGAVPVAQALAQQANVAHFGVACASEAMVLREAGIHGDVYTLSPFLPDEAETLLRADVTPMVSSREQLRALAEAARRTRAPFPARCFLKVDTGMGRSGCLPDEARALWTEATGDDAFVSHLRVTGLATHFADADGPDPAPTERQAGAFLAFLRTLPAPRCSPAALEDGRGNAGLWLTWANTPATLRLPPPRRTNEALPFPIRGVLVRTGLALYGIEPYPHAYDNLPDGRNIRPALAWRARITLVRDLPAGATVGYGQTCTLARSSRVATVAAGYADGLPRRLSNLGHVLLRGQRCAILGRVSMDQCQADVTDVAAASPVVPGEVVTLIGRDGDETQTVLDIARLVDTTPHEPTCALTPRVVRRYAPLKPPAC
jgi:alanine racemase